MKIENYDLTREEKCPRCGGEPEEDHPLCFHCKDCGYIQCMEDEYE